MDGEAAQVRHLLTADERQRFVANIGADAERLLRLTQRLLELTRAEVAGASRTPVDINQVVARLAKEHGARAHLRNASTAESNENVVVAVLETLLDNAHQHGGDAIDVHVDRTPGGISVTVSDNGTGISPGNRDRIFEPFFTTSRDGGGTGLGLTIAAALLEGVGGSIEALAADSGAAFRVTFPEASNGSQT